jgi:hypothetical protein
LRAPKLPRLTTAKNIDQNLPIRVINAVPLSAFEIDHSDPV